MFAAIYNKVTSLFDGPFLVNYFLPSLIFWVLLGVVYYAERGELAAAYPLWTEPTAARNVLRLFGFFAWVMLFANVVASESMRLLRFFEGYWNFPGSGFLRRLGASWHQRKLAHLGYDALTDDRSYQKIYSGYPLPTQMEHVMPTRLGNILKNAELYPRDRYQIDAVIVWPRLYNCFPDSFKKTLIEMKGALDFMLVISAAAGAFAFIAGAYLLVKWASPAAFLVSFGGGLLASVVAYQGAIANALLYAQQIKAGFDLYRNQLLTQMKLPLPRNIEEEERRWAEVGQFLYRNIPPDPSSWVYNVAGEPEV